MPRGSKKTAAAKVPVTLYWVSTADHDEDWFIFAKSTRSAAKFHADYEGYGPREPRLSRFWRLRKLPVHSHVTLKSTTWPR